MKTMGGFNRNTKAGGGRGFGGGFMKKRPYGGSNGGYNKGPRSGFGVGSDRPQLYDAVCAECGEETQVPFRPNGRKPVLCRDCYQAEGGTSAERFGGRDARRPAFDTRDSFGMKPAGDAKVERHLVEINAKLDRIVEALEALAKRDS